mgnify:FL=1
MAERAETSVDFSRMATFASLSVLALVVVSAWQIHQIFLRGNSVSAKNAENSSLGERASTPYGNVDWQAPIPNASDELSPSSSANASEDKDGISNIEGNVARVLLGSYTALNEAGIYTREDGEKIAKDIAISLRANISYKIYGVDDIKIDSDTSYDRMLAYRSDLRKALEPLLGNPGYELKLFANYIGSNNPIYTEKLAVTSKNYQKAVAQAANITVPEDAAQEHLGILNALSEFGTIVEKMATHADDAFAAAALLQTYNTGEINLLTSFNSLATYYRSKKI